MEDRAVVTRAYISPHASVTVGFLFRYNDYRQLLLTPELNDCIYCYNEFSRGLATSKVIAIDFTPSIITNLFKLLPHAEAYAFLSCIPINNILDFIYLGSPPLFIRDDMFDPYSMETICLGLRRHERLKCVEFHQPVIDAMIACMKRGCIDPETVMERSFLLDAMWKMQYEERGIIYLILFSQNTRSGDFSVLPLDIIRSELIPMLKLSLNYTFQTHALWNPFITAKERRK